VDKERVGKVIDELNGKSLEEVWLNRRVQMIVIQFKRVSWILQSVRVLQFCSDGVRLTL
jgi:uncharacterized protein with PhoU and TrkA domain